MNRVSSCKGQRLDMAMAVRFIAQDEAKKMSKYRVIQKNLVHIQGFPDLIADSLVQYEYLGQFGKITKLVVVKGKEDAQSQTKKSNSAYITFSTNEEAANAVLALDSYNYNNHLIRAFFGTSKYCIHFLNNKECYNKDKCMYLHSIASEEDVLGNTCGTYSKFDYSEHLQIALSISRILIKEKKDDILKAKCPKTIFPNIKSIYSKDFVIQAEQKQLDISSPAFIISNSNSNSNSMTNNNSKGSAQTSTNDEDSTSKSSGKLSDNYYLDQENQLYHYRTQSRFVSNEAKKESYGATIVPVPFYIVELVDKVSSRFSLFKQFNQSNDENEVKRQQDYLFNDSWSEFINSNIKVTDDK